METAGPNANAPEQPSAAERSNSAAAKGYAPPMTEETPLPFSLYDRQGQPIRTAEALSRLTSDPKYMRVAETYVFQTLPWPKESVWISTVWLHGVDHGSNDGNPILFETMLWPKPSEQFPEWDQEITGRYSTEDEALAGHQRAVRMVRSHYRLPVVAHSVRAARAVLALSILGAVLAVGLLCLTGMELIALIS